MISREVSSEVRTHSGHRKMGGVSPGGREGTGPLQREGTGRTDTEGWDGATFMPFQNTVLSHSTNFFKIRLHYLNILWK